MMGGKPASSAYAIPEKIRRRKFIIDIVFTFNMSLGTTKLQVFELSTPPPPTPHPTP